MAGLHPRGGWHSLQLVTVGFALLARILRGVTPSGALAGGFACFLLFASAGPFAFAALGALFVMTWMSTRIGYRRKLALGIAEPREGRTAWQIIANLAMAALGSIVFGATGSEPWLIATLSALAEAATDTVASEIGQYRNSDSRLITSWESVPAGTGGGITLAGTVAGHSCRLSDCGRSCGRRDTFPCPVLDSCDRRIRRDADRQLSWRHSAAARLDQQSNG